MTPLPILWNITLPIFSLLAIGFALDKAFHLDIQSLTRISFYVFGPAIAFQVIVNSELNAADMLTLVGYSLAHVAVMAAIGLALFSARPFAGRRVVLIFSAIFYNAGNYGFPLMLLAFNQQAVGIIAIVLLVQVVVMFTIGLPFFIGEPNIASSLGRVLKLPVLYAVVAGFAVRALGVEIPGPIMAAVNRLGDAFVATALVTLGAQLARSQLYGHTLPVSAITLTRLVFSPLVAAGLVALLKLPASMKPVLIVGAGLPAAVNIFILATEFGQDAEFASQIVFWTTTLSAITIPILLWLIQ